ncbi:MAG: ctpB, partial [Phycisphaerales bacterium]|nr:ctpB [Phycisphaerales bacterium]
MSFNRHSLLAPTIFIGLAMLVPRSACADVKQLKLEALEALKAGHFDTASTSLAKAASEMNDANLSRMAESANALEARRRAFAAERQKQFDRAVGNANTLLKADRTDDALNYAAQAYLLAEDKRAFRNARWVDELVRSVTDRAKIYEAHDQWLKALRVYVNLGSLEPAVIEWTKRRRGAATRIRLLATFNPEAFRKSRAAEAVERLATNGIIRGAVTEKGHTESYQGGWIESDWREPLKGITAQAIWDILVNVHASYYRTASFRDLGLSGLGGLEIIATTKGLETAFPGLSDETKRTRLATKLHECIDRVRRSTASDEQAVLTRAIREVLSTNDQTVRLPEQVLASEFASAVFADLDPLTAMIWPTDVEGFTRAADAPIAGVGIGLASLDDGDLRVTAVAWGSALQEAGICVGDILTRVDHKITAGAQVERTMLSIRGKAGTTVTLTVRDEAGRVRDVDLIRGRVAQETVQGWNQRRGGGGGWDYLVDPQQKIAYVRITQFSKATPDEMALALAEVRRQNARGLILDLRDNPGGLLSAATEVCDKFLSAGEIVTTRPDRETPLPGATTSAKADPDDVTDLPMVVLVNRRSASGSEIVSGALKDHRRALILGERTMGIASVQMLYPVAQDEAGRSTAYLKLT